MAGLPPSPMPSFCIGWVGDLRIKRAGYNVVYEIAYALRK